MAIIAKKKSAKAKVKAASAKKSGSSRDTSGLKYFNIHGRTGTLGAVLDMFIHNEKSPANKRLTDLEIRDKLRKQFGKKSYFDDLAQMRSGWNRGRYTKDGKPAKIVSHKYDESGKKMAKNARYDTPVMPEAHLEHKKSLTGNASKKRGGKKSGKTGKGVAKASKKGAKAASKKTGKIRIKKK